MSHLEIRQGDSLRTNGTGQTESMKAAVYLQTNDIPNAPLGVGNGYFRDTTTI